MLLYLTVINVFSDIFYKKGEQTFLKTRDIVEKSTFVKPNFKFP